MLYQEILAAHIISVIAWMAGLLYLPRLYVYHCRAEKGSKMAETFKIMESRLLYVIMYPAMLATYFTGHELVSIKMEMAENNSIRAKLVLVGFLTIYHLLLAHWRRQFARDDNRHTERFYRIVNEVPTLLMIAIIILVVVKPI